mmetsp:Transcript_60519/g.143903  ORF Transcript_60519/g.143903 Transcript_60519/m.143903 type:complete len:203 (+) Transcript_60519:174-782(+)
MSASRVMELASVTLDAVRPGIADMAVSFMLGLEDPDVWEYQLSSRCICLCASCSGVTKRLKAKKSLPGLFAAAIPSSFCSSSTSSMRVTSLSVRMFAVTSSTARAIGTSVPMGFGRCDSQSALFVALSVRVLRSLVLSIAWYISLVRLERDAIGCFTGFRHTGFRLWNAMRETLRTPNRSCASSRSGAVTWWQSRTVSVGNV